MILLRQHRRLYRDRGCSSKRWPSWAKSPAAAKLKTRSFVEQWVICSATTAMASFDGAIPALKDALGDQVGCGLLERPLNVNAPAMANPRTFCRSPNAAAM